MLNTQIYELDLDMGDFIKLDYALLTDFSDKYDVLFEEEFGEEAQMNPTFDQLVEFVEKHQDLAIKFYTKRYRQEA